MAKESIIYLVFVCLPKLNTQGVGQILKESFRENIIYFNKSQTNSSSIDQ